MINNNVISFEISAVLLLKSMVEMNKIIVHEDAFNPNCIIYLNGQILGVITEHDSYGNLLQNNMIPFLKKIFYVKDKLNLVSNDDSNFFVGTMQELNAMYNGN